LKAGGVRGACGGVRRGCFERRVEETAGVLVGERVRVLEMMAIITRSDYPVALKRSAWLARATLAFDFGASTRLRLLGASSVRHVPGDMLL
jgi:hypothetical protein